MSRFGAVLQVVIVVVVLGFSFQTRAQLTASEEEANQATQFCLKPTSTRSLIQMPIDKPHCAALQTGVALATYFGYIDDETLATILVGHQRTWALAAIKLACLQGDIGRQPAIRLIQACNCENGRAIDIIENNQDEVIRVLKVRSGRHPDYPGCENAPTSRTEQKPNLAGVTVDSPQMNSALSKTNAQDK